MEIFDVVDAIGMPTGETVERKEAHAKGIRHRTAHIWVIRKKEGRWQVLLQKRAQNKDSFPGRWDTSSSGHIQAGDEPEESAVRELGEELGIQAEAGDLKLIGHFDIEYTKEFYGKTFWDNEYAFVYAYEKEARIEDMRLQEEEVEAVDWFDLDKVVEGCAAHDTFFCVPMEGLMVAKSYMESKEEGR